MNLHIMPLSLMLKHNIIMQHGSHQNELKVQYSGKYLYAKNDNIIKRIIEISIVLLTKKFVLILLIVFDFSVFRC